MPYIPRRGKSPRPVRDTVPLAAAVIDCLLETINFFVRFQLMSSDFTVILFVS